MLRRAPADLVHLRPACRAAWAAAVKLFHAHRVAWVLLSAYRSHAVQDWLYRHQYERHTPVASPGRSLHCEGRAVDVVFSGPRAGEGPRLMKQAGWYWPLPRTDPPHFEWRR